MNPTAQVLPVGWNMLTTDVEWSVDNTAEVESGLIVRADTTAELAARIGLDAETLETMVAGYNAACAARAFGRVSGRTAAERAARK